MELGVEGRRCCFGKRIGKAFEGFGRMRVKIVSVFEKSYFLLCFWWSLEMSVAANAEPQSSLDIELFKKKFGRVIKKSYLVRGLLQGC